MHANGCAETKSFWSEFWLTRLYNDVLTHTKRNHWWLTLQEWGLFLCCLPTQTHTESHHHPIQKQYTPPSQTQWQHLWKVKFLTCNILLYGIAQQFINYWIAVRVYAQLQSWSSILTVVTLGLTPLDWGKDWKVSIPSVKTSSTIEIKHFVMLCSSPNIMLMSSLVNLWTFSLVNIVPVINILGILRLL